MAILGYRHTIFNRKFCCYARSTLTYECKPTTFIDKHDTILRLVYLKSTAYMSISIVTYFKNKKNWNGQHTMKTIYKKIFEEIIAIHYHEISPDSLRWKTATSNHMRCMRYCANLVHCYPDDLECPIAFASRTLLK